ncbi:MAG: hypothetical protein IPO10_10005 [Flavobacteriales bacterium]|nr:hypothetical protein [Flavobacteriales bacterium]
MSKWIKYGLWALFLCTSHWSLAQTRIAVGDSTGKKLEATDYFNTASKKYVKEQKIEALKTLDKGLKAYPGDPRLLKLAEELIKEEERTATAAAATTTAATTGAATTTRPERAGVTARGPQRARRKGKAGGQQGKGGGRKEKW